MNEFDIKKIREQLNVSQEKLAEMLGVHPRTVQNWESGTTIPKAKHAMLRDLMLKQHQYAGVLNKAMSMATISTATM